VKMGSRVFDCPPITAKAEIATHIDFGECFTFGIIFNRRHSTKDPELLLSASCVGFGGFRGPIQHYASLLGTRRLTVDPKPTIRKIPANVTDEQMAFKIPGRWTGVLPDNLASAQLENELQRMILRGMEQGARVSDIARSLKLSRAQACQIHKALLAKAADSDLFQGARHQNVNAAA
jgi:hypothetical protein